MDGVNPVGFGESGRGVGVIRLGESVRTRLMPRVFRRVRFEDVTGRRVANFRDVFVATAVTRTEGKVVTSTIHVDGFVTEGDDPANYSMGDFGNGGRVSLEMSDKSPDWSNAPAGFTVVSRDLLAVVFPSLRESSDDAGLVELYDLRSGRIDSTLAKAGRIVISKTTGIDDVHDIAFRAGSDDGSARLVVAGVSYRDGQDSVDDVVIAGVTTAGTIDPEIGIDGSGTISLSENIADFGTNDVRDVRLADPGLSQVNKVVGALVTSWIPNPPRTSEAWQWGETHLTAVVARAPRAGGPITMDPANGAFANSLATGMEAAQPRNVILDSDYSLDAHITGHPFVATIASNGALTNDAQVDDVVSFASASPMTGVSVRSISVPFVSTTTRWVRGNQFITDLSAEGKHFVVDVYSDIDDGEVDRAVCFGEQRCDVARLPAVRKLIDISPLENAKTSVPSMRVDAEGVHVLVQREGTTADTEPRAIFSLTADGLKTVDDPATFGGDVDGGGQSVNPRWTDSPIILGRRRLAAIGSNLSGAAPNFIFVSDDDAEPRDVPLSLPLGVRSYSSDSHQSAMLDASSLVLTANVHSDAGRERRLYKVNIENGSVDVTFGVDGRVSGPVIASDGDVCESDEQLVSGPGVVAALVIDRDPLQINGFENCGAVPASVSWSTFTATGTQVGEGLGEADVGSVGFTRVTDYLVDARGSLYVIGYRDVYEGDQYVASNTTIAKFTVTGSPDESFGAGGVLSLDGTSNELFGAGIEMIAAVDQAERLYIAAPMIDAGLNVDVSVLRLTSVGMVDGAADVAVPKPGGAFAPGATPRQLREIGLVLREAKVAAARAELARAVRDAALPANDGLTVTATRPVLTAVDAIEDRALTVFWSQSAARQTWATATALPGGRTCTSDDGTCVIRGLDPALVYTITVVPKGEKLDSSTAPDSITAKPVVTLRAGRVASPTIYVRPASQGKATWKVRGGCTLNDSNTRVIAPMHATTCQLNVTTAKFGPTPKTTKSVTIVVKK